MDFLLKIICKLFGNISHIYIPKILRSFIFKGYASIYGANLTEINKNLEEFETFSAFFIRDLKQGAREVSKSDIISPVDGTIIDFGQTNGEMILRAKGSELSLSELLCGSKTISSSDQELIEPYKNAFYLSIYLGPGDYHQIHSPVTGDITNRVHIPGAVYPVGENFLKLIPRLYAVNERVSTFIQLEKEENIKVAVVKVGALNVSSIGLAYEQEFNNRNQLYKTLSRRDFNPVFHINKFDKLGVFYLGSTVILLVSGISINEFIKIPLGNKIKVGQSLLK